jgi:hypothetical protein
MKANVTTHTIHSPIRLFVCLDFEPGSLPVQETLGEHNLFDPDAFEINFMLREGKLEADTPSVEGYKAKEDGTPGVVRASRQLYSHSLQQEDIGWVNELIEHARLIAHAKLYALALDIIEAATDQPGTVGKR